MEENEKQKDMNTKKRGRTGHSRVMRKRQLCVAGDATKEHGIVLSATRRHVWVYGPAAAGSDTIKGQADVDV